MLAVYQGLSQILLFCIPFAPQRDGRREPCAFHGRFPPYLVCLPSDFRRNIIRPVSVSSFLYYPCARRRASLKLYPFRFLLEFFFCCPFVLSRESPKSAGTVSVPQRQGLCDESLICYFLVVGCGIGPPLVQATLFFLFFAPWSNTCA